jgi:hypothetical protein
LVAGHYQPLADNPGVAPESDQTGSLQSVQRTLEKAIQDNPAWLFQLLLKAKPSKTNRLIRKPASA